MLNAQCIPYTNAVPGITLSNVYGLSVKAGLAYNPDLNIYYSVDAANWNIQCYNDSGQSVFLRVAGFDYRGLWWNPNRNTLEGNGHDTSGICVQGLNDSTGLPRGRVKVLFPANQPNPESGGAYDYTTNNIFYYFSGRIYIYSRRDNTFKGSHRLNGIPVPKSDINSTCVIYTGCVGKEIGIYDYVNRRVYLFDKTTGNISATVQLPSTAPTPSMYSVAYANNLFWLYDPYSAQFTWRSYSLFVPAVRITLNTSIEKNRVLLNWQTRNEFNSKDFTIEKSKDGVNFKEFATVKAIVGNNIETYKTTDMVSNEKYYYRLKQTDNYGNTSYSSIAIISSDENIVASINPNPVKDILNIQLQGLANANGSLQITDMAGRLFINKTVAFEKNKNDIFLSVSSLKPGIYTLKVLQSKAIQTIKFVKE